MAGKVGKRGEWEREEGKGGKRKKKNDRIGDESQEE